MTELSDKSIASRILAILRQMLSDLGQERAARAITSDASLEHDLGLDSLSRVELFSRIEKAFAIKLPETVMAEAETVNDIIHAIAQLDSTQSLKLGEHVPALEEVKIDVSKTQTLLEALQLYAKKAPDRIHLYLQDQYGVETPFTYGALWEKANKVAQGLVEHGLKQYDTVAIMLPTSESFFCAFFGVQLAGGIPIPIYPPFRANRIEEYALRESTILRNAEVRILITFHQAEKLGKLLRVFIPSLKAVTTVNTLMQSTYSLPRYEVTTDDAAMIQYTSGSTSDPKGVLLHHKNLLANIRAYGQALQIKPTDSCVSWLPLYHDMGLIGAWLGSFYYGLPATIMSPLSFLSRPERWLWSIHYHRATVSAGPNFAYELCIHKIDDKDIEGLDLSSWKVALNGAEAINPETLTRFTERFSAYGFKPESLYPVYGLAENSVALTFPPLGRKPRIDHVLREPLENENKAVIAEQPGKNTMSFVACGSALPEHEIRIVDSKGYALPERTVGHLQFRGPSAMQGYYRNEAATQSVYHDGWWDTGDLAYIADDELFITGREKDLIIKAGRNLYPAEIEETTSQVSGVRKGCVAVFGVADAGTGTEKLVIVAETKEKNKKKRHDITANIIENVATVIGIPPDQVILCAPGTIPKTSSGKLRRSSCKANYLAGKLGRTGRQPVWLQVTRLLAKGTVTTLAHWIKTCAKFIYTMYASIVAALLFIPGALSIMLTPQPWARKLARFWFRVLFLVTVIPIKIKKAELADPNTTSIFVVNHASYIDALILIAALPSNIAFVAKKELQHMPIIAPLMKKLGYLYTERIDFMKSVADAEMIEHALQEQQSLVIFPEGTFTYTAGLRSFKLGAFQVAAHTQTPIYPVATKGTRWVLRASSFLISPHCITVTYTAPLTPKSDDWDEVMRLRSLARDAIAQHCGEEKLDI